MSSNTRGETRLHRSRSREKNDQRQHRGNGSRKRSRSRERNLKREIDGVDMKNHSNNINKVSEDRKIKEKYKVTRQSSPKRISTMITKESETSHLLEDKKNILQHGQPDERRVWGNVAKEEEEENMKRKEEVLEEEKEKANFGLTGALAKDSQTGNMYNGILLKWTEALDAARPTKKWRLYVFKDGDIVETLYIHRQSAYLIGRETLIADIVLAHPSCSKQHAVIQYRLIEKDNGSKMVSPYIMDLQSTNKTFLNGKAIEDSRYVELREKDCLRFGLSTREYVLLHDNADKK